MDIYKEVTIIHCNTINQSMKACFSRSMHIFLEGIKHAKTKPDDG